MVYDADYREVAMAAVDTEYAMTAQGADTPNDFDVPTNVLRITEIRIGLGGINGPDTITGTTSAIHLSGSGITIGEGYFPGPTMSNSGAAATAGGFDTFNLQKYEVNIPVKPGGKIHAAAMIHGEDPGTAQMFLTLVYDGPVIGKIRDYDYREIDIGAAANTLYAVVDRWGTAAYGDFRPVGTIGEIVIGNAVDPTGDANNPLGVGTAVHLTGSGLVNAGNYKYIGPCGVVCPDTDVTPAMIVRQLERYVTNIQVKLGSTIRASAQNIESIQVGHCIVGFGYL